MLNEQRQLGLKHVVKKIISSMVLASGKKGGCLSTKSTPLTVSCHPELKKNEASLYGW
jgi:hypothetical protein